MHKPVCSTHLFLILREIPPPDLVYFATLNFPSILQIPDSSTIFPGPSNIKLLVFQSCKMTEKNSRTFLSPVNKPTLTIQSLLSFYYFIFRNVCRTKIINFTKTKNYDYKISTFSLSTWQIFG